MYTSEMMGQARSQSNGEEQNKNNSKAKQEQFESNAKTVRKTGQSQNETNRLFNSSPDGQKYDPSIFNPSIATPGVPAT